MYPDLDHTRCTFSLLCKGFSYCNSSIYSLAASQWITPPPRNSIAWDSSYLRLMQTGVLHNIVLLSTCTLKAVAASHTKQTAMFIYSATIIGSPLDRMVNICTGLSGQVLPTHVRLRSQCKHETADIPVSVVLPMVQSGESQGCRLCP